MEYLTKVQEILIYELKPNTGNEFHRIMQEESVPLHERKNMKIVSFGQSLHDSDSYFLVREYESMEHLESSQQAFYSDKEWLEGPREKIIELVQKSSKSVIPLSMGAKSHTIKSNFNEEVSTFLTKLRNDKFFDEQQYEQIFKYLSVEIDRCRQIGVVPLLLFKCCIYLVDALAGGSRFLSDEDAERVQDASDQIYDLLI